jgi:hypothetical protein
MAARGLEMEMERPLATHYRPCFDVMPRGQAQVRTGPAIASLGQVLETIAEADQQLLEEWRDSADRERVAASADRDPVPHE